MHSGSGLLLHHHLVALVALSLSLSPLASAQAPNLTLYGGASYTGPAKTVSTTGVFNLCTFRPRSYKYVQNTSGCCVRLCYQGAAKGLLCAGSASVPSGVPAVDLVVEGCGANPPACVPVGQYPTYCS